MKYYLVFPAVILMFGSLTVNGQANLKISKKDFKNDKTGFKEAWKNVTDGDSYYRAKGIWYKLAYDEYVKANAYNNLNPELNYKTGVSALFSDNKELAAEYFLKAFVLKGDVSEDILLLTGRALQYAGRYQEAIEKLNSYLNEDWKKSSQNLADAGKYLEECKAALQVTKDTLRVDIKNIGSNINSNADDYAELFSADDKTMFFASRRELSKSGSIYDDTKHDENIFFSVLSNGTWGSAATAGKELTTRYCETPLYLSSTNEELYIYTGYENKGDIQVSVKKRGAWKAPKPVPFKINSRGSETSMTFSPMGNEIWFVSDKGKEAQGGKDIYMIKKLDERKWSKPVNAGPNINSALDEESVRFSERGDTLWFSSKGHNTIGGYDIFYSVKDQIGYWGKAVNAGYPVNTPWDELFYTPAKSSTPQFYLASNRSESIGGLDIFNGRVLPPEPVIIPVEPPKPDTVLIRDTVIIIKETIQTPAPAPVVVPEPPAEKGLYLIGSVKDSENGAPVLAKIDVIDLASDQIIGTTASSDVDGSYRVKLPAKKSYMIDLRSTGFLSDMKRIDIPDTYEGEFYNLDVSLIKVKVGKKVVLNNILFETGKSVLTASSYTELNRLVNILEDNPLMRIEISGHTDNTGSEALNFRLSESRAKAVVNYLVQKSIDRLRLEFKGYGPQQPIADNKTSEGRKMNRRVEFKILEF